MVVEESKKTLERKNIWRLSEREISNHYTSLNIRRTKNEQFNWKILSLEEYFHSFVVYVRCDSGGGDAQSMRLSYFHKLLYSTCIAAGGSNYSAPLK